MGTVAEAYGAEVSPQALRRHERTWATLAAIAVLLVAELAAFSLVAARGLVLSPHPLTHYQPTLLAGHLPALAYDINALRGVYLGLLAVMVAAYLVALRGAQSLDPRVVAGAIVGGHLVALVGPLLVTDVYNYVDFARLAVVHHLNPYVAPPNAATADPLYRFVTWQGQPTSYGPLFTLATYPLALIRPSFAVWAVKLVTLVASLVCVGLVYLCARRLGRPARACALAFGLNPLVLVYAVGGAHNDFLMLVLVLAAVYLVISAGSRWSAPALVAAVGIKAVAAPVLLFALIHDRRARTVALAAASAAVLALVTIVVFGVRAPGISDQSRVLTPYSVPDAIGRAFGIAPAWCQTVGTCAAPGLRLGAAIAFLCGIALVARRAWRGADWLECAGWAMVVVIATLTSVMPWYVLWLLPFAVLSTSRRLHLATAAVTVLVIVGSVPVTYLLVSR